MDSHDIVQSLNSHEEALKLVIEIDEASCDWDFTMMCAKHFATLVAECKGDVEINNFYEELKEILK